MKIIRAIKLRQGKICHYRAPRAICKCEDFRARERLNINFLGIMGFQNHGTQLNVTRDVPISADLPRNPQHRKTR
jgi:hypothetical protein